MSKHSRRHRKARMIRAAAERSPEILCEAAAVEWIHAADADGKPDPQKPKRFAMLAYTGGPMNVGYYGSPVVIDLAGLVAKTPVPILLNHDIDQIVGHADEIEKSGSTLKLAGVVSGASAESAQVEASAKLGFPWKASVGARPDKMEFVGEGIATEVNGKKFTGPLYVARKSTLGEVSFVPMAADGKTTAKVAATAAPHQKGTDMNFQAWIEALGLVFADLTDRQKASLEAKYNAELKAAEAKPLVEGKAAGVQPPAFDLAGVVLSYEKHVAAVQAKAASYVGKIDAAKLAEIQASAGQAAVELKLKALDEQWPVARLDVALISAAAKAEVELIRAELPKAPAIHASGHDLGPAVIEAAFATSCGLRNREKHFKPEVLEAADRHHRGLGLQELLLIHAMQAGYAGRMRVGQDNLKEVIRAAFSTHALTTLLTTTGNKILLDGFMSIPQSWREVAQVRAVNDFKTVTAFRLTAGLEYEELPPSGEIHHGTVGQESYTLQAKTYARMLVLTRTDIINDDLGAFNDLRNRLGLGSAIAMNKVFWTAFLAASSGGAFWTAARANLVTGSALGESGLNTAVAAFRNLAGPDGNMMNLEPDRILVPAALEATARKLYVSQEQRDTTASTKFPTANIYFNRFRPVVVPELGNSAYTGYSPTTWYLLANPAILATALMCFLGGQESPTIESAEADFDTLGIQFRGYHDFGASMSEYRASVEAQA